MITKRADGRTVAVVEGAPNVYFYDEQNARIMKVSPTNYWVWITDGVSQVLWSAGNCLSLEAAEAALAGQVLLQREA